MEGSVGVAMDYELNGQDSIPGRGKEFVSPAQSLDRL
jgi:hypothetical protein